MCGRYSLITAKADLTRDFPDLQITLPLSPRYNVAPGTEVPILLLKQGNLHLASCHWGFGPPWAGKEAPAPINARVESVAGKPYFRESFRRHRCVFPANGFYEWQSVRGQHDKKPWYFSPRQRDLWYFAGIATPSDLCTAAILVTATNPQIRTVHDRMPVILDAGVLPSWLEARDKNIPDLLRPYDKPLSAWVVSRAVNRPSAEDPSLIAPVTT